MGRGNRAVQRSLRTMLYFRGDFHPPQPQFPQKKVGTPKEMKLIDSAPEPMASLQAWLETRPNLVPLSANDHSEEYPSLLAMIENYSILHDSLIEAILCLRIGKIDRAHELVQSGSKPIESYLHGVVHRLEGDFWNAKYWFRQINDRELLSKIGNSVAGSLRTSGMFEAALKLKVIGRNDQFDPAAFVDACEAMQSASTNPDVLQKIGQAEWDSLWQICQ